MEKASGHLTLSSIAQMLFIRISYFILILQVTFLPLAVAVMVVVPFFNALTVPLEDTEATLGFWLFQVTFLLAPLTEAFSA